MAFDVETTRLISTHAPRTGSDTALASPPSPIWHFNPRSPHGERRRYKVISLTMYPISTHAPRTGSDINPVEDNGRVLISTHAPRTGSDNL